ncbi:MAG: imidazole glycerol phosphate synthase subunit HisH, partial [Acidobacteria bacterium]|nr:imidazole glycerol phosphate synthase subunit HisH [Acidobacteriota bacterium]
MKIAIVKYNAGNTASVTNALCRLGVDSVITDDHAELKAADKIIFPGVGEASSAMAYLRSTGLDEVIGSLRQPFLGICLGMQLLCTATEENDARCLGVIPLQVRKFSAGELKVPQIGWNTIDRLASPLFEGIAAGSYVYFVHGYYVESGPETVATAEYG